MEIIYFLRKLRVTAGLCVSLAAHYKKRDPKLITVLVFLWSNLIPSLKVKLWENSVDYSGYFFLNMDLGLHVDMTNNLDPHCND